MHKICGNYKFKIPIPSHYDTEGEYVHLHYQFLQNDLYNLLEINRLIRQDAECKIRLSDNNHVEIDYDTINEIIIINKPHQHKFYEFKDFVTQYIFAYKIQINEMESVLNESSTESFVTEINLKYKEFIISNSEKFMNLYNKLEKSQTINYQHGTINVSKDANYVNNIEFIDFEISYLQNIYKISLCENTIHQIIVNKTEIFEDECKTIDIVSIETLFNIIDNVNAKFKTTEEKIESAKTLLKNNPELSFISDTLMIESKNETISLEKSEIIELLKK